MEIDDYILDTLMPDLAGHDRSPSAFLVYLHLWRKTVGAGQKKVALSYQALAEGTGLSKSAVQNAVRLLKRRELVKSKNQSPTATPEYKIERPWSRRRGTVA